MQIVAFWYDFDWYAVCLLITSFFLINYLSCILDIEKPDGICSTTFVLDEYLGLFLHPSIFSIKHSSLHKQ